MKVPSGLQSAKITSDKAEKVAKTQTSHKRLDKLDFIYGNVVFSSPDIIKSLLNQKHENGRFRAFK